MLVLILGLRLGEALGLPWESVNLDAGEIDVKWQAASTRRRPALPSESPGSDAPLPLPVICVAAIKLHAEQQAAWQGKAGQAWHNSGLVITTRYGTPYEPRNFLRHFFLRHFALRCRTAGVR